jgi:DNA (cytosine-5)-methyltransferase 1
MKAILGENQTELFQLFKPINLLFFQSRFTFVDLFAGIGGFRIALEELGGKCLGYSEIDQEAIQVYHRNFINYLNPEEINLGDITNLSKLSFEIDILVGGVPCQPWSIAGKSGGFNDPRGRLWFDVIRLVENNKPKGFIFENVKGLTEPRHRKSFELIIHKLKNTGYTIKSQLLTSYDFGIPQDRERVFIVGIRDDIANSSSFTFPSPLGINTKIYEFIDGLKTCKLSKKKFSAETLFGNKIPGSRGRFQKNDELNDFFILSDVRDGHTTVHSWDLIKTSEREKIICQTILKNRRKKIYGSKDGNPLKVQVLEQLIPDLKERELEKLVEKEILRYVDDQGYEFVNSKISAGIKGVYKIFLPHSNVIGTLTATGNRDFIATISIDCKEPQEYKKIFIKEIYIKRRFKPLSARDYARLQGFPDWFVVASNENTAKKQFGNAVSVPVVYHLTKSLLNIILYGELKHE